MKNRTLLIIKLIVLLFVLVIACFVFIFGNFRGLNFRFNEHYPSLTSTNDINKEEDIIEMEFNENQIADIRISMIYESIDIIYHNKDNIKVVYDGTEADEIEVGTSGNELVIYHNKRNTFFNFFNSHRGSLTVYLPTSFDKNLIIDNVSGNINVSTKASTAKLNTVSGKVDVSESIYKLDINTVSGRIVVSAPTVEAEFETVSGSVEAVIDVNCDVSGNSVSGSFLFRVLGSEYEIDLESISGDLDYSADINISKNSRNSIEVETVSGNLKVTK